MRERKGKKEREIGEDGRKPMPKKNKNEWMDGTTPRIDTYGNGRTNERQARFLIYPGIPLTSEVA